MNSGDVHLGAVGRFYTPTRYNIDPINDHRFMVNIISSAITNKPPPRLVADMIGRRNKIHHLDHETHETLLSLFDVDPGGIPKNANTNNVTMPSRNYAIISYSQTRQVNGHLYNGSNGNMIGQANGTAGKEHIKDGHSALHAGEVGVGVKFPTANGLGSGPFSDGLDVCLRVEIDNHDREGKTEGYGFSSRSSDDAVGLMLIHLVPPLRLVDDDTSH